MFFNIIGATSVALLSPGDGISNANTIHLNNLHSSDAVLVDLYISTLSRAGGDSTYYILKSYSIASKTYLNIESSILSFPNNNVDGFGLFIKLNNADSKVDVIIK